MADKTSRLAEIYKSEKAKGGGLASTFGKRALEKIDPRQMFDQKGLLAAALPSVFKAYKATPADKVKELSTTQSSSLGNVDGLISEFRDVKISSTISAKNSMSLPSMARDMNVMRQNIGKLVKLQGGTPREGADMFFKKASENEASYETQFRKEKTKPSTSPTQQAPKKEDKGILGSIMGMGTTIAAAITGVLGTIFSTENLGKIFGVGLDIMKGLGGALRTLLPILTNPVFLGIAAALVSAKWLMDLLDKKNSEANTQEKQKLRIAQDRGSQASKSARRTFLINDELKSYLKDDRTDEELSDFTSGEIRTKDELRAKIAEAEASGKRAIEIKESRVVKEAQAELHEDALKSQADGSIDAAEMRRMKIAPTPTPTPMESSGAGGGRGGQGGPTAEELNRPTQIPSGASTGPNGEFKSKQDFLTAMYPLAVKASEKLGGVDPNALLTQWGFESAWGSKTSGKYNYFGIKADKNWSGDKKDVMTHEYLQGEKVTLPQPFRSYGSPEEAVDDYVNFLKNNKAKTSGEYFGALQKAGYATDPNYASKLTSATESTGKNIAMLNLPTPSTGSALVTTSTQVASASGQGGPTIVNNNTTNNTMASAGQKSQGTSTIPSAFDDVFIALLGRVT
jgi:flagellum-specific peptidoglycan hydrolase FlgJ